MKKLFCFFLAVMLLFISMSVPAAAADTDYNYRENGYFIPSPEYPNAESLPYGVETLVYDIECPYSNYTVFYRFFLKKDLYTGSEVSAFNGSTTCFVSNGYPTGNYEAFVASQSPVYYQRYYIYNDGSVTFNAVNNAPYYKTKNGLTYNFVVLSGSFDSSGSNGKYLGRVYGNAPTYYGGRSMRSLVESNLILNAPSDELPAYTSYWFNTNYHYSYISASVASSIDLEAALNAGQNITNEKIDNINDSMVEGFSKLNDSINHGATQIAGAITDAAGEIINAGSDLPTLDTDDSWMKDSITKMDEWLSQLNDFEKQLEENKAENSENMAEAKTFVNGFFNIVPTPIVACMGLVLVIIVVVKIVGR